MSAGWWIFLAWLAAAVAITVAMLLGWQPEPMECRVLSRFGCIYG